MDKSNQSLRFLCELFHIISETCLSLATESAPYYLEYRYLLLIRDQPTSPSWMYETSNIPGPKAYIPMCLMGEKGIQGGDRQSWGGR